CLEQHPVPKTDGLFAILSGEQFTKLDVSHAAYQQIVLEEDSKKYVTVTTRKGLLRYNQLPFGVSSVPAIFQCTMEGLLQGIPHVAVYLDDILVTGMTEVEHLENLEEVLNRLEKAGLCLRSKCTFKAKGVVFLGHKVDATGLHPVKEKVQAIQDAPAPSNVSELKAYLAMPQMASPRIQRWALTLRAYEYKAGRDHGNADALSRLPLPERSEKANQETVLLLDHMDTAPVIATQIKTWTGKDPASSKVCEYVLRGWPNSKTDAELTPFFLRRHELSVQDGCILRGARIIVPKPGHGAVMEQLHQSHPGITRMKGLARSYMWWLKMDVGVERKVQSCRTCQEHWKAPAAAPLHPWEWPDKPWRRLHIVYAGPFLGKMFLVIVLNGWMFIPQTHQLKKLKISFSTHGLPEKVVSDNGTPFVSAEFSNFTNRSGIIHVTSAPYHPSTNGLAERAVQTFKECLKKISGDSL
uniref:Gypsy retrotransposon integrase-like protein 1 n=1 Tax=Latimeria chalumnae TaxID=7897 RepID=H3ARH2_LATCH